MTTISKALRSQDPKVYVACKIVCIHLFFTKSSVLLNVLLVDAEGKSLEAKSWNPYKAYFVYFNFEENQNVLLHCTPSHISDDIDERYSKSDFQTSEKKWTLHSNKYEFHPTFYFPVYFEIATFHNSDKPAKSLVGMFVEAGNGPLKYGHNGRVVARGSFIKLRDANNCMFRALVWINARKKFETPLDSCNKGDIVMLPYAREQSEEYRSKEMYTVTTIYPLVVKPKSINVPKVTALLKNSTKHLVTKFNPYV